MALRCRFVEWNGYDQPHDSASAYFVASLDRYVCWGCMRLFGNHGGMTSAKDGFKKRMKQEITK